nr:replication factor A protein 1-like isoform X2 [Ipomoea batatas]GMD58734.1 replication factor A protein 1-like isoform X2 [Ipomoea batatas]
MAPQFILASQLSPLSTKKAMRVRLVRTYEVRQKHNINEIKSKECVFHDEEGTYFNAIIPKEQVMKFRNVLTEGGVYGIKNFLVITNFYKYKTTTHRFMIKFNYATQVKEYMHKHKAFPKIMFRLQSIESLLLEQNLNDKLLIDVIGKVTEIYSPLDKIIDGKTSRLIDFIIEDGHLRDIQTPVKSISSTSMLSCGNVANDLRDGVIQVHSIAELYENTEIGEFWVAGKITGIETTGDWFFKSCLGCYKKLSDNNGGLCCRNCGRKGQKGLLKYRLIVRVADGSSNAPFLIWDRECTELVGLTAEQLKEKYPEVHF